MKSRALTRLVQHANRFALRLGFQLLSAEWHGMLVRQFGLGNGFKAFSILVKEEVGRAGLGEFSQRGQDAVAFFANAMILDGYFVEIGAASGVAGSNTFALEQLGWHGLVVEPAQIWHQQLKQSRTCDIDTRAVWNRSGESLEFLEQGELSTFVQKKDSDFYSRRGRTYFVDTVSVDDLFAHWSVPSTVNFLSVDTEGSELEILSCIDFDKYKFNFICVEHNYTASRDEVKVLLESVGYRQIMGEESLNDSYFVPVKPYP